MHRVLIVCPYPPDAPSQRFRFGQYVGLVDAKVDVRPFWTERAWKRMYKPGNLDVKVLAILRGFAVRAALLFALGRYDVVFIHREATPVGPPWWEWVAARLLGKKVVYDFDDAIWLPNNSEANAGLVGRWKMHGKVNRIMRWSRVVTVGNEFLADHARRFAGDVRVVPTTIDTDYHVPAHGQVEAARVITLGWTGSHSTLKQLTPLFPILEELHEKHPFRLLIVADSPPDLMPEFAEFRPWSRSTEIRDLREMDIGLMPLYDTPWERGKCGFKALQYMAMEIPAVVSAVGVNADIVRHGIDGFAVDAMPAAEGERWTAALTKLLVNPELRRKMGRAGRARVEAHYSVKAHTEVYRGIFWGGRS